MLHYSSHGKNTWLEKQVIFVVYSGHNFFRILTSMPFVYSPQPGSALPDIARGALPLTEWDLWIDSNEPVVMVADAPDSSVQKNPSLLQDWLRGKTTEWFGGAARFAELPQIDWGADTVMLTGKLASTYH